VQQWFALYRRWLLEHLVRSKSRVIFFVKIRRYSHSSWDFDPVFDTHLSQACVKYSTNKLAVVTAHSFNSLSMYSLGEERRIELFASF